MRHAQSRRPGFELLEARLALSTMTVVAKLVSFPGPLSANAALLDTAPTFQLFQAGGVTIGGRVQADVSGAPGGVDQSLKTVTYTILGGAIGSQVWTVHQGSYTTTAGTTHATPATATSDTWTFYWDQNPGQRKVSISATYTDGAQWSQTFTPINVTAPTPSGYSITAVDPQMGPLANNPWGFYSETGGQPGVHYVATIFATNPGVAGFLQLVNIQSEVTGTKPDGTDYSRVNTYPAGVMALDTSSTAPTPLYRAYSTSFNANTSTQVGGNSLLGGWNPEDGPGQGLGTPTASTTFYKYVYFTYTLTTYLDYQPPGGIHIAVGQIDWSVFGTTQYIGPTDPIPSQAVYQDPSNWDVTGEGVHVGNASYSNQIATWDINVQDANVLYTTVS